MCNSSIMVPTKRPQGGKETGETRERTARRVQVCSGLSLLSPERVWSDRRSQQQFLFCGRLVMLD